MKGRLCYGENRTLEGGCFVAEMDSSMKQQLPHIDLQLFDNQEKKQGSILRKAGSKKLYVLFYYFNKRVEKTTGLNDTVKNRQKVRLWLDRIFEAREPVSYTHLTLPTNREV